MSNRTVPNSPAADEPPLRTNTDGSVRVYRLPRLGAVRPVGGVHGVPPWEPAGAEEPPPPRPARDYYFG